MTKADVSQPREPEPKRTWLQRHATAIILSFLGLAALLVFLAPDILVTIGPGEAGVLWKRFGGGTMTVRHDGRQFQGRIAADSSGTPRSLHETDDERDEVNFYPYTEGMRVKWPWDKMFIYNVRLQQHSETYDVLTAEGLQVKAEITIRWKLIEGDLGKLHRDIGPEYLHTLIIPSIGAFARQEIATHETSSLYSAARFVIQEAIRMKTKDAFVTRFHPAAKRESYLIVEDVLLRSILLPADVASAIEDKAEQMQLAESYVYRIQREEAEARRKTIEATGIRDFQATVNQTISPSYLRWKGIEATLELAKSNNTKIVVVGAGTDGLPIILGGLDTPAAPPPAPAGP